MTLREIYDYIRNGELQKFCNRKSLISDINIRLKERTVINSSPRYIYHLVYDDLLDKLRLQIASLYLINDMGSLFSDNYEIQLITHFDEVFYIKDLTKEETVEE